MNTYFNDEHNIGSLIQVGSGSCYEINDYIAQGFEEIILLEPNPKVFKQLENKIAKVKQPHASKITALNVALSAKTAEQKFYVTQPNRYSGFNKPDKLKQLFQNLKLEQQITVNTLSFSDLIKQTSLDENQNNALVLQINGAEFDVLSQAEENDLMLFSCVVIQHCKKNYFQQAQTNNDLITLMKNKGFQLTIEEQGDVVFSNLVFFKDEATLKINALKKRNIELENQLKASNEAKAGDFNKAAEKIKSQTARIAELDIQLKASNEAKASEVTEARAKANAAAEQSKIQAARIAELDTQLKASNEAKSIEINKAAEQIKTQTARIAELVNLLKASNEAKAEEANKVNAAAEQSKIQATRIAELDTQLKANNEAKSIEVNKAAEQIKTQTARIAELDLKLKASNETKSSEANKANAAAEQNKTQAARISHLVSEKEQLAAHSSNIKAQLTALQIKQDELVKNHSNKDAKINTLTEQRDNEIHWHHECKKRAESLTIEKEQLVNNISQLENDKLALEKENIEIKSKLVDIQEKLISIQEAKESKLELLANDITKKIDEKLTKTQNSTNRRLDKGLQNAIKQIESFHGLQSYLTTGEMALEYHGWPISSDIALFLVNKIQENNYDLIIEFGSGTSTALFAKSIKNETNLDNKHIASNKKLIEPDSITNLQTITDYDLPKRVVTFEHNKKYYEKTLKSLKKQGLTNLVDLVHAPLIDYKLKDESYLYYACSQKLDEIARVFEGREAKILVLIDGPPGATGPLARLPAIPHLLNSLGNHQLDLVLDDYNRDEEKQIAERWKKDFESRFIKCEEELIPCEKGAWFCRVNP